MSQVEISTKCEQRLSIDTMLKSRWQKIIERADIDYTGNISVRQITIFYKAAQFLVTLFSFSTYSDDGLLILF